MFWIAVEVNMKQPATNRLNSLEFATFISYALDFMLVCGNWKLNNKHSGGVWDITSYGNRVAHGFSMAFILMFLVDIDHNGISLGSGCF